MSLEVGAGIKRQAEEGFLLEAGGKEGISELHSKPARAGNAYSFLIKSAFTGDVWSFKTAVNLHISSVIES